MSSEIDQIELSTVEKRSFDQIEFSTADNKPTSLGAGPRGFTGGLGTGLKPCAEIPNKRPVGLGASLSSPPSGSFRPSDESYDIPPIFGSCVSKQWYPKNNFMFLYSSRIQSFKNWPKQIKQKPEELAQSGFYYHAEGDFVHCFYCGVTIHNWETFDNVNFEHRRHSPSCKFLSMICDF